jgi:hypothetical protein
MKKWIQIAVVGAVLALPAFAWAKGMFAADDCGCDCPICCHLSGK